MRAVQRKKKRQEALVKVKISYQGTEKTVTALWDTGNQLCEPYGGQPVHVVTGRVCEWLAVSKRPLSLTHQYEMLLHGEEG